MDFNGYTLPARLIILVLYTVGGWLAGRYLIWPPKYGVRTDHEGYTSAMRSWRWFAWQPGLLIRAAVTLAIMAFGLYMAFPEIFGVN